MADRPTVRTQDDLSSSPEKKRTGGTLRSVHGAVRARQGGTHRKVHRADHVEVSFGND